MKFCDFALGGCHKDLKTLGMNLLPAQSFGGISPTQRILTKRVVFRCGKGLIVRSKEGPAELPSYFQHHLAEGDCGCGIPIGDNKDFWNRKQILSAILFF